LYGSAICGTTNLNNKNESSSEKPTFTRLGTLPVEKNTAVCTKHVTLVTIRR